MKLLLLVFLSILATASCRHPVVSYGIVRPPIGDSEETQLGLDDNDELVRTNRCNDQRFRRCIQSYADDLDLDTIPKDSLEFVRQLTRIVRDEGLDGFKKTCTAGKNLKSCLGPQFDQCISEDYLKSVGVEEVDAKVFVTLSAQITFQCTQGFDAITNNWECIARVERGHRSDFERCQSEYARKVAADPSKICKYTQDMVNCMTVPFKRTCPPVVYGVLCHSLQVAITTTLPQCSIICTKGLKDITHSRDGRQDTVSAFLARVFLENTPAHQFQAFRSKTWTLTGPTCDDSKFKRCANQFAKDLGLAALPSRAAALAGYLGQLIATRRAAGFEQVCKSVQNLGKCVGDQMDSCFSAQHLEQMGIQPTDVLIYRELQATLASECGPGYEVMHRNIDCMINCAETHMTEFTKCTTDLARGIERDPSHTCDYVQTYLRCYSQLLGQCCGADLKSAACDGMKAELSILAPQCKSTTCTSQDDLTMIGSKQGTLVGRPVVAVVDAIGESVPVSTLRQLQTVESDSDEDEAPPPGQKCNDQKFGQCMKTYAEQLGLKNMPTDPAEFAKALQALLAKYGKIGFKKICTSGAKMTTCLGPRQAKACINVTHLMELGLTKQQATTYYVIFETLHFECTKVFRVLYDNFDCIMQVEQRSNETFIKCGQDFVKKIKQDPKNTCKYAQELVNCDVKPFTQRCKRQAGNAICQIIQFELKIVIPKCPIRCDRQEDASDQSIDEDDE